MEQQLKARFGELLERGRDLVDQLPRDEDDDLEFWVEEDRIPEYQTWIASVANLIRCVALPDSYFAESSRKLLSNRDLDTGVPSFAIQKLYALLVSANDEWTAGLLRKVEHFVVAATFDDFLDHADLYHKGGKKIESAVLASTVLEDTIKKIAAKHNVGAEGKTLDPLIDALVKADVFSPVRGKRLKSYAAVRNHALHAEWERLELREIGELIKGTRELLEEFL